MAPYGFGFLCLDF